MKELHCATIVLAFLHVLNTASAQDVGRIIRDRSHFEERRYSRNIRDDIVARLGSLEQYDLIVVFPERHPTYVLALKADAGRGPDVLPKTTMSYVYGRGGKILVRQVETETYKAILGLAKVILSGAREDVAFVQDYPNSPDYRDGGCFLYGRIQSQASGGVREDVLTAFIGVPKARTKCHSFLELLLEEAKPLFRQKSEEIGEALRILRSERDKEGGEQQ